MLKLLNSRIIFLDLLRAFAVIAMIQSHMVLLAYIANYLEKWERGIKV